MKKLLSIGLTICITLSLNLMVKAQDKITVTLDGTELVFDVEPQIIDDFTMVPMRIIFESLGYSVCWYDDTKRIFAIDEDDNYIEMTIDSPYMYAGGNSKERASIILEIAPQIIDDRTLVPVRAVAEAGGCKVEWNGNSRTVLMKRVIETSILPLQPQQPEDKEIVEINNNVDFINGIFDIIKKWSPEMRTYGFYDYYNDLAYRLSFEMRDLKAYLSSIPEDMAEQIKSRAQNKAYDAYRYVINNSTYGSLSGAVVGSAVEAAYNSYVNTLLNCYY